MSHNRYALKSYHAVVRSQLLVLQNELKLSLQYHYQDAVALGQRLYKNDEL
jgi:hypothetical protein